MAKKKAPTRKRVPVKSAAKKPALKISARRGHSEKAHRVQPLRDEIRRLKRQLRQASTELEAARAYARNVAEENRILKSWIEPRRHLFSEIMSEIKKEPHDRDSTSVISERGHYGPKIQGGLPGLGKRR